MVTASVDEALMSSSHVSVILNRFEAAMRQCRHDGDDLDNPISWPIASERKIQNILWLMLRPVFDDLVEEEPLDRINHSTYRADFGAPSLALLIKAKYTRKASDFKSVEKEIYYDYVGYLSETPYRNMICLRLRRVIFRAGTRHHPQRSPEASPHHRCRHRLPPESYPEAKANTDATAKRNTTGR
ncbi:hypothetical protein ACFYVC_07820 [Streptomyces tendae]|uniref:PD-(D/E)XK nuclease domain-containing protein n=1 Tax=Streptomyces tendae TaxID=1932 RepID=UPI0036CB464C